MAIQVRWVEKKMKENYWSLPSLKVAEENRLVLGVNIVVRVLRLESPDGQYMASLHE